ncbi:MAG: hypothetical protein ACRDWT_15530 [Jatrophihabitantaceae bacterium]
MVDRFGQLLYVVDVLWRELRAVLEINSREYHLSEREWKATMDRHNELTRYGLAITHYPPSTVGKRGWSGEVADWLRERASELGVAYPLTRGVITSAVDATPVPIIVRGRSRT